MKSEEIVKEIEKYEHIIFDFGGIFFNINYEKIIPSFKKIAPKIDLNLFYDKKNQIEFFDQFETGKISPSEFRSNIKQILRKDISDSEIDNIWNSMLDELPAERYLYLEKLSKRKNVYLFSNINQIHEDYLITYFSHSENSSVSNFYNLFKQIYFSFKIGKRKPNINAFEHVVNDLNISPSKILFVDDSLQHVEGAKKIGINAVHLEEQNSFIVK